MEKGLEELKKFMLEFYIDKNHENIDAYEDYAIKLAYIIRQVPSTIIITDTNGIIKYVNPSFTKITGYTFNEILGQHIRILKSGHTSHEEYHKLWDTILAEEEWSGYFLNKKKNSELYWEYTEISSLKDSSGKITHYISVKNDITDMKKAEEELVKEKNKAQMYLDIAGSLIIILDKYQNIQLANKKAREVLGVPTMYMIGRNFFDCFTHQRYSQEYKRLFEDILACKLNPSSSFETVIVSSDSKELLCNWDFAPLKDDNGNIVGIIGSGEDITKRSEIDKMKNEVITTVSHEIRTPLASIRGFAELMFQRELSPDKIKKYLSIILRESERLTDLIDDFLDIQRMESGKQNFDKKHFKFNDVLVDTVSIFKANTTHKLIFKSDIADSCVYADYDQIRRLLVNLVSNAYKYSDEGKNVYLKAQIVEDEILVEVQDEGIGIPSQDLPKLFDKFFRVDTIAHKRAGGTGLGLSICKEIIDFHSGKIWVESELNKGSSFYFKLKIQNHEG